MKVGAFHHIMICRDRPQIVFKGSIGGAQYDWQVIVCVADLLEEIQAIVLAQPYIQEDQIRTVTSHGIHHLAAVGYAYGSVSRLFELL
jgi:hypothetical protein